jgi:hypothetical protein
MIRTISTMEDSVLVDLIQRVPSHRKLLLSSADNINNTPANLMFPKKEIVFTPPFVSQPNTIRAAAKGTTTSPLLLLNLPPIPSVPIRSTSTFLGSIDEKSQVSDKSLVRGLSMSDCGDDDDDDLDDSSEDSQNNTGVVGSDRRKRRVFAKNRRGSIDSDDTTTDDDNSSLQFSFGRLLSDLPKEGESSVRSLYGMSTLDESVMNFESAALEELAKLTDQMVQLLEDSNGDHESFSGGAITNTNFLTEISEHDSDEDEHDNEAAAGGRSRAYSEMPQLAPFRQTPMPDKKWTLDEEDDDEKRNDDRPPLIPRPTSLRQVGAFTQKPAMARRNTCGTLVSETIWVGCIQKHVLSLSLPLSCSHSHTFCHYSTLVQPWHLPTLTPPSSASAAFTGLIYCSRK